MREMLRGVWILAILVVAFAVSYYVVNDPSTSPSSPSSDLSPVSSMPAPATALDFVVADDTAAPALDPSAAQSPSPSVPSTNQLIESIESERSATQAASGSAVRSSPTRPATHLDVGTRSTQRRMPDCQVPRSS